MTNEMATKTKKSAFTFQIEFLFNDSTAHTKRQELSPTGGLPRKHLEAFVIADLMDLSGCTKDEATDIYSGMMEHIDNEDAVLASKEFPNGSTFTISVQPI